MPPGASSLLSTSARTPASKVAARTRRAATARFVAAGREEPVTARIDFGDGEPVPVRLGSQRALDELLSRVGAAGLRRRGANRLPTYGAPLETVAAGLRESWEYLTWPPPR